MSDTAILIIGIVVIIFITIAGCCAFTGFLEFIDDISR